MKKKCFVLSSIGDENTPVRNHADIVLRYLIRPALGDWYDVDRADNPGKPGQITSHIVTSIEKADLVVADLTFRNPNVYYELGLAHMWTKPVVYLLQGPISDLAFDLHNESIISYDAMHVASHDETIAAIRKHANDYVDGRRPTNPVTAAIGAAELNLKGDSRDQILGDLQRQMTALTAVVTDVTSRFPRPAKRLNIELSPAMRERVAAVTRDLGIVEATKAVARASELLAASYASDDTEPLKNDD